MKRATWWENWFVESCNVEWIACSADVVVAPSPVLSHVIIIVVGSDETTTVAFIAHRSFGFGEYTRIFACVRAFVCMCGGFGEYSKIRMSGYIRIPGCMYNWCLSSVYYLECYF